MALSLKATHLSQCLLTNTELMIRKVKETKGTVFCFCFFCAVGLPLPWPLPLQSTGSRRAGSAAMAHGAQPLRGMWDPPGPGHEPTSPASAGGLSTTAPPGKPSTMNFNVRGCGGKDTLAVAQMKLDRVFERES